MAAAHKDRVVASLIRGVAAQMKAAGVAVVSARAALQGRNPDGTFAVSAGGQEFTARFVLLCTGSQAAIPPIPGIREALQSGFAVTSRELLERTEAPARLVVIGGGVIGLEMASYFRSAGSQVTVVEMLEEIGGGIDGDMAAVLRKNYEKAGVVFHTGARVESLENGRVLAACKEGPQALEADCVLVCTGRRPALEGAGLETVGVLTQDGRIPADEYGRTNIPGLYAAGDVLGRYMLAHAAYREGEVCVSHMLGKEDAMSYRAIPSVIYTSPEAAAVGLTERQAAEQGRAVKVRRLPLAYSGRYVAENGMGDGFCKLLTDPQTHTLLGGQMVGPYASECITAVTALIDKDVTAEEARKIVFPHPTVCEVFRECLFG